MSILKSLINSENNFREYKRRSQKSLSKASPFIQWVGGKRQIMPIINENLPKSFGDYYEPFLGGGAVYYNIFDSNSKRHHFLSDLNRELITTYRAIKNNPEEVIDLLGRLSDRHSKEFYYKVRNIDREQIGTRRYKKLFDVCDGLEDVEVAARFIYLNKSCFNAIYRVNGDGLNNVPVGKSLRKDLNDNGNILLCSGVLNENTTLSYSSYEEAVCKAKVGDFVYFDPPYEPTSETSSFTSYVATGFNFEDQKKLKQTFCSLSDRGVHVMLSNSNSPKIKELYKEFSVFEFDVNRCINSKGNKRKNSAREIIVKNY